MHRSVAWSFAVLVTVVLATTASATTIVYDITPFTIMDDQNRPLSLTSGTITARVNVGAQTVTSFVSASAVVVFNNDTANPVLLDGIHVEKSQFMDYTFGASLSRLWMDVPRESGVVSLVLTNSKSAIDDVVWNAVMGGEGSLSIMQRGIDMYASFAIEDLTAHQPIEIATSNGLPEPTSLALLGIGATALLRRRKARG